MSNKEIYYLKCPFCGAIKFYNEFGNEIIFFKITYDHMIETSSLQYLDKIDLGDIYCVSCSFGGTVDDLKK